MQKDKMQRMQGIGLFFAGLGSIIVAGTYALDISNKFTIIGITSFLIGAFYFRRSETLRRKLTTISN
ncbi:MAG: hypothetical protein K8R01_05630 [Methanococcoides sp.]|nr:hypothetical protein [Methanococcoides sp.]MCD4808018.1 hypothetical protein [Methanococcoides sp.]